MFENFIPAAHAATTSGATSSAQQGSAGLMLWFAALLAVFYFLMWRPQSKRAKEHRQLIQNLTKGDEVITSGGILGRIIKMNDDFVDLSIAEGVEIKIQKNAISASLPKGTMKAA